MSALDTGFMQQFVEAFNPASPAAAATVQALLPVGQHLFFAIAALLLGWMGLKAMLDDGGALASVGLLINTLIMIGLVWYPLSNYTTFLGWINEGFDQAVALISGGTGVTQAFAGFSELEQSAWEIWRSFPANTKVSWTDFFNIADAAELVATRGADYVTTALAMAGIAIAAVLFVGIYCYALVMFLIGAVVGPIMLPWYLLSPFRFIADGWIRFMINAGMQRVVAISLISVMSPFLAQMNATIRAQAAQITSTTDKLQVASNHMVFSFGIMLLSLLIIYIMTKIPEITNGLLGGGNGTNLNIGGAAKAIMTRQPAAKPDAKPDAKGDK